MKVLVATIIRLISALFFLVTAVYCLLAYQPYTYYAFVKAPPQSWIPWFALHHVQLSWLICAGLLAANWDLRKTRTFFVSGAAVLVTEIIWTIHPFMRSISNNGSALIWGGSALVLLGLAALPVTAASWLKKEQMELRGLNFSSPVIAALIVALLGVAGTQIRLSAESHSSSVQPHLVDLLFWSVITHAALAVTAVAAFNLLIAGVVRTRYPRLLRLLLVTAICFGALLYLFSNSFATVLSFDGWRALTYAMLLAAVITLTGMAITLSLTSGPVTDSRGARVLMYTIAAALAALELSLPAFIGHWDWNGVFLHGFTMVFWLGMVICLYLLRQRSSNYSVPALLGILIITVFTYQSLRATEMFWSRPLGRTDYDIEQLLEQYSTRDISFQFAHYALGNGPAEEKCGQLCRILRQYTNIRNPHTNTQVKLVDPLLPTNGPRPNIFIIVVDSMRPDYLGAYNPKVDFTPHIDGFARDSIVFRSAYSDYAGTTLSEPAIWSGALLLHAHYLQPFSNVNSLEKLATVDRYQMYVTYDTVLRQLLSPADDLIKLDANTLWDHYDFCQTSQEFFQVYDSRPAESAPIFFYSQPMNVHQFANNRHPTAQKIGWSRKGFSPRISLTVHQVDECMGNFLANLKKRGLYDNSVIILTSDHGDATGELGRSLHAEIVYPEVMHVPLIVHLPKDLKSNLHYDANSLTALTDIAPSLYYLLGHRPIRSSPLFGLPFIAQSAQELETSRHHELFLASDTRAAYGILDHDGRYFYATYDRPVQSYLYDLANDPLGTHDVLTAQAKRNYDDRILDYLTLVARFYGYKPGLESMLAVKYQTADETESTSIAHSGIH